MRTCNQITGKYLFLTITIILTTLSTRAQLAGQLPVNLKTFKAMAETNKNVKVFWTTEYEKDNGYFDIERSVDGVWFTKIARLPGKNNNGVLTDYVFYDYQALGGISFYRLKQVDIDQKYSYSPIERVKNTASVNSVDLYPNPSVSKEFKINLLNNVEGSVQVMVFDQSGKCCLKQQFSDNNTMIVRHQLPSGTYFLKISGTDLNETRVLIVL